MNYDKKQENGDHNEIIQSNSLGVLFYQLLTKKFPE